MMVTTRNYFNYVNPACKYQAFLKKHPGMEDGPLSPGCPDFGDVLEAMQQGTLAGEQVQHNRSDDEVDCGD